MGASSNKAVATGIGLLGLYFFLVLAFWVGVIFAIWKFVFA